MTEAIPGRARLAFMVMLAAPLLFSTNLIFGRGVIGAVSPFTLAFLRWLAVAAVLSPFMLMERAALKRTLAGNGLLVALAAFLGMWICGGVVYLGLQWTTATNGTLIYTTSPVLILLMEAAFRGRRIGVREAIGAAIALTGVAIIVLRGEPAALLSLSFNTGDLLFVAAAISWAAYSLLVRTPGLQGLSNATVLGLLAAAGAVLLLPAALYEWASGGHMPVTAEAWGGIAGIVVFSSLLAFSAFQFGVRELGPSLAGVFMYLLPPCGVLMAVLFLGERLQLFHLAGIALVMGGVVLATLPAGWFRRGPRRRS